MPNICNKICAIAFILTHPNNTEKRYGYIIYKFCSKYSAKNNSYTVEGIGENLTIPKGAEVVTTGMGDIFPSGLLVGYVTKVTTDNFDLSKVAVVESSVNFNDLDYVSVLKRKDS